MEKTYRSYVLVNLEGLVSNVKKLKEHMTQGSKFMAVIKADAYGHGAVKVAKTLSDHCDWFAVASAEEAIELRKSGIHTPILVLGFVGDELLKEISDLDITISGYSLEYIKHIEQLAESMDIKISMHVEIDTGFNRIGIPFKDKMLLSKVSKEIASIYGSKNLNISGIYTHFSTGGSKNPEDIEFLKNQYRLFNELTNELSRQGIKIGLRHCCNSKVFITNPEMHMDMVRVGHYMYGIGSEQDLKKLKLVPIMNWKARIYAINTVQPGESVGYSRAFKATRPMKIGVISIGFADGYPRSLCHSENVFVIVNGKKCKILGKICMDVMMIDLSNSNATVGDYITLMGEEGDTVISPDFLGKEIGGTAVEITSNIGRRVTRVYES